MEPDYRFDADFEIDFHLDEEVEDQEQDEFETDLDALDDEKTLLDQASVPIINI